MEIRLIAPENLDYDELIERIPFPKMQGLKKDYLKYIISTIMKSRSMMDDEHLRKIGKTGGYVPLNAKVLEHVIPKYKANIEYLKNAGVIECDESYQIDVVSKGYRLMDHYITPNFKYEHIDDCILRRKLKKKIDSQLPFTDSRKLYPDLHKWFAPGGLKVDKNQADELIDQLENADKGKLLLKKRYAQELNNKRRLIEEKYRNYRYQVDRIADNSYYFLIDETGHRLHTNLTNFPKVLRQFLSYDGQPLVAVDIKNSQPYMSLPLLSKKFWQEVDKTDLNLKNPKISGYREGIVGKHIANSIVKFCDSSETLYRRDLQKSNYQQKVLDGTIYEHLASVLEKEGRLDPSFSQEERRNKAKKMVLTLLFDDDNKRYNQLDKSPSQLFRKEFPSVAKVFSLIKKSNYKALACLLQRIESYLVLDIVCKRISQEKPEIPIFTIHDSIVTTRGNEGYVAVAMSEELQRYIGFPPKLKPEYWSIKESRFYEVHSSGQHSISEGTEEYALAA